MPKEFQHYLFDQIARKIPPEKSLVAIVAALLEKSASVMYKKIRGDVPLSLEEGMVLQRTFDISADQYLNHHLLQGETLSLADPVACLTYLRTELAALAMRPSPRLWVAGPAFSLFACCPHRALFAFRFYMWARLGERRPEWANGRFDPALFYQTFPQMDSWRNEIWNAYAEWPSCELWPPQPLATLLAQLRFSWRKGLLPWGADELRTELEQLLREQDAMALGGRKRNQQHKIRASVEISLNELAPMPSILLFLHAGQTATGCLDMVEPHTLLLRSSALVARLAQQIEQIATHSTHISRQADSTRRALFQTWHDELQAVAQHNLA